MFDFINFHQMNQQQKIFFGILIVTIVIIFVCLVVDVTRCRRLLAKEHAVKYKALKKRINAIITLDQAQIEFERLYQGWTRDYRQLAFESVGNGTPAFDLKNAILDASTSIDTIKTLAKRLEAKSPEHRSAENVRRELKALQAVGQQDSQDGKLGRQVEKLRKAVTKDTPVTTSAKLQPEERTAKTKAAETVKMAMAAPAEAKAVPNTAKAVPAEAKTVETKTAPDNAKTVETKTAPDNAKAMPDNAKAIPDNVKATPTEAKVIPAEAKAEEIPEDDQLIVDTEEENENMIFRNGMFFLNNLKAVSNGDTFKLEPGKEITIKQGDLVEVQYGISFKPPKGYSMRYAVDKELLKSLGFVVKDFYNEGFLALKLLATKDAHLDYDTIFFNARIAAA